MVGTSGYVVNLSVYAVLLHAGVHYAPAVVASFLAAFVKNYSWHRRWTFRARRPRVSKQGIRYAVVVLGNLGANLLLQHWMVGLHVAKVQPRRSRVCS